MRAWHPIVPEPQTVIRLLGRFSPSQAWERIRLWCRLKSGGAQELPTDEASAVVSAEHFHTGFDIRVCFAHSDTPSQWKKYKVIGETSLKKYCLSVSVLHS